MSAAATVGDALLWPLAAGVAVVIWSKARASARTRRAGAVEAKLRAAYREVEGQPVPERLEMVMGALEEGEELAGRPKAPADPR